MSKLSVEMKKLDAAELTKRVDELRTQLAEQNRSKAAGELANPMATKKTRKQIAIALTLLQQLAAVANQPTKETK